MNRKVFNDGMLYSITDAKARPLARDHRLTVEQVKTAFNIYDNCVESGEAETMSVADMGVRFRQCIGLALQAKDPMVWNRLAREFRDNYDFLKRKRW